MRAGYVQKPHSKARAHRAEGKKPAVKPSGIGNRHAARAPRGGLKRRLKAIKKRIARLLCIHHLAN